MKAGPVQITRGGVAQAVLVVVGGWLMFAPSVLGHQFTNAGESDRIAGPAIVSIAFLAIFTITRLVRWLNLVPGGWLLLAPWVLDAPTDATISNLAAGLIVLSLATVERADQSRYGGGWMTLFDDDALPRRS